MWTYVLRRILWMIPTLFGITVLIWLLMIAAPGEPSLDAQSFRGEESLQRDPQRDMEAGESARLFRRQFGLDRPTLLNTWTDLDAATVREDIRNAAADITEVGGKTKQEALRRMEDYSQYSVPPLVELLQETSGTEQEAVLYWLRRNSLRQIVRRAGEALDEEEVARQQKWARENQQLKKYTWQPGATEEERAAVVEKWTTWHDANRERWDYSAWAMISDTKFGNYWGKLGKGDLGMSLIHKRPVTELIGERLKYTLSLNVVALIIAYILAVPLGVLSAVKHNTWIDRLIGIVVLMLYSLPNFFTGTLLIMWFTLGDPWQAFPTGGFESDEVSQLNVLDHIKDVLWHITLPLGCLSYGGLAILSRLSRTGMLDVIRSDYVRTARAKGLSEWVVILKHVVRNGILPIITVLGTALPVLIGGSIAIEYIFNINGMGLLAINSIQQRDYNVVIGIQLIASVLTMIGILIADLAYAVLDPRISLR